jgi:hypothetical protein
MTMVKPVVGEPAGGAKQSGDVQNPDLGKLTDAQIRKDRGAAPIDHDPKPGEVDPEPAQNVYAK